MSRHHMLPPIIYTPPQKPNKIETRKRRHAIGMFDQIEETPETGETVAASQSPSVNIKLPPAQMPEIEGVDREPEGPAARLSRDLLAALLRAQELK